MKVCMINGSPKIKDSCCGYLIDEITKLLNSKTEVILHNANDKIFTNELFISINSCDVIVFVFPLYVDAIPSHLILFLEAFQKYLNEHTARKIPVYAISNCGFFEGEQNKYALSIIENFCERTALLWKFGLGIGSGPFIEASKSIPWETFIKKPIYQALIVLKNSIETGQILNQNIYVTAKIPRRIYIWAAHIGWRKQAKINNLKTKDLY